LENTLSQYDAVVDKCRDIFAKKTHDYGTAWRILRTSSLTDQIFIKANRIRTIQMTGENKVEESIDDAFIAIVNYAAMALVQIELGDREELELPILMKILRIKQIEDNEGVTKISEGVEGSYLDMLNYAVFALIQMGEEN